MNGILFDTDVLIDILRGNQKTLAQVEILTKTYQDFYCSTITIAEIFAGMKVKEETATRALLDSLTLISVDGKIAEIAGSLKAKTKNRTLWLDDCLIGATAVLNHLALATKNVKHYPFKELKIEGVM